MSTSNGHGGPRPGSGRPRSTERAMRDNKVVERKLKSSAELGWEVLAERYPDIMRRAIDIAIGGDGKDDKRVPNVSMLKTLLELMVKVVGSEPEQADTEIKKLVGRFIDRAQEARTADGPAVDRDSEGRDVSVDGGHGPRSETDTALPGVERGFSIERT